MNARKFKPFAAVLLSGSAPVQTSQQSDAEPTVMDRLKGAVEQVTANPLANADMRPRT